MRLNKVSPWVCLIICIFLINIMSVQIGASQETRARVPQVLTELRFNLGQEVQEADVKSGLMNYVCFTGVVNGELVASETYKPIIINLNATTSKGWNTTVNPKKIIFSLNDYNVPFSITVWVPYGTLVNETDIVTLSGNYSVPQENLTGDLDPISGSIFIRQYYVFNVNTQKSYSTVESGKKIGYLINTTNNGNGRDIYRISVKNLEELLDSGIDVTFSDTIVEIEPGASKEVRVTVKTSKDTKDGNHVIVVVVKSELEEKNTGLTYPEEEILILKTESSLDEQTAYLSIVGVVAVVELIIILILIWSKKQEKKRSN